MDVQKHAEEHSGLEMPPRSRLYHLPPLGVGTLWVESLTSYVNRLAWTYRVSPRVLVAQEIDPLLSSEYQVHSLVQLATFSRSGAMGINGTGNLTVEWSTSLLGPRLAQQPSGSQPAPGGPDDHRHPFDRCRPGPASAQR